MAHDLDDDGDLDLALDFEPIEDVDFFAEVGEGAQKATDDHATKSVTDANVSDAALDELYASMDVDRGDARQRLEAIFIRGVDNMTTFDVERVFAEHYPDRVEWVDDSSCNVVWSNRASAAQALLALTRPLKRVRSTRQPEEGEVTLSDEEEEGQLKAEAGDEVALRGSAGTTGDVVAGQQEAVVRDGVGDCVEIDVDKIDVPPGKWRVIISHVSSNTLLIVRFSRVTDVKDPSIALDSARTGPRIGAEGLISGTRRRLLGGGGGGNNLTAIRQLSQRDDTFSYKWTERHKVRPGLNIFTNDGKELEWDYEHDTRYYVDVDAPAPDTQTTGSTVAAAAGSSLIAGESTLQSDVISNAKRPRVRGRGTKKARMIDDILAGDTMRADEEAQKRPRRNLGGGARWDEEEDDAATETAWRHDDDGDRDPSPTPQPWDRRPAPLQRQSVHERLHITVPNENARKRRAPQSRDDDYSDPDD